MKKNLIIDFCGTITDIQTSDYFVYFSLSKLRHKIWFKFLKIFQFITKKLNLNHVFKFDKSTYLKLLNGYDKNTLENKSYEFSELILKKHIRRDILEVIRNESKNYNKIVVISAGLDIYVSKVCNNLGLNEIFSSKFVYFNDIFNGKIDRSYYGIDKLKLIEEHGLIDENNCISVITDSSSDMPIIQKANEVILAYPDQKLLKLYRFNNWKLYNEN